jgi:hypothetical protein
MNTKLSVKDFAEQLSDAYSTSNYNGNWSPCIKMLRKRGYDDRQIEAIIRSKWTRWAADGSSKSYGKVNSKDLAKFLDKQSNLAKEVAELVKGTFPSEGL